MNIDIRTKRPLGDHGTADDAINFALDAVEPDEIAIFLRNWRDGETPDEWPEYYVWLAKQESFK